MAFKLKWDLLCCLKIKFLNLLKFDFLIKKEKFNLKEKKKSKKKKKKIKNRNCLGQKCLNTLIFFLYIIPLVILFMIGILF